jgi:glycosyltransferase involved in cell wall biosynthesis
MQLVLSLMPGGTERLTIDLVTRLSSTFPMVVCCLDEAGQWAGELSGLNVPVVGLERAPGFHPSIGARVAAVAARYNASVIHCHHYSPFIYGRLAVMLHRRARLVFTEHGRLSDAPPTMKRRIANTVLSRFAGPVYTVSNALKQHLVAEGFAAAKIGVIHNGIEPGPRPSDADRRAARRLLDVPDDALVIGTAARLDVVKDLGTLVAAASLVRSRRGAVTLCIIGDGGERASLEAALREHQMTDHVRLTGFRPDVRRLLPAFDIYVNSSVHEGVSLTILEAMAAALPVVATHVGGTPEIVVDGRTGSLVEPRRPESLARAIDALAQAPERRAAFGLAGRARVEASFTIDRMVAEYAREYARLGCR